MTGAGLWRDHSERAHGECVLGRGLLGKWLIESSSSSCSLRRVELLLWRPRGCEGAEVGELAAEEQHSGTIWVCSAAAMCHCLKSWSACKTVFQAEW
jgi:hypothetical protein